MTRTPKTPATGVPRAGRVAQAEPGEAGPVTPVAGPAGKMSPQPSERLAAGKPAPGRSAEPPLLGTAPPRVPATRSPAVGVGASPAPAAGLQAAAAKMSEDRGPDSLDAHVRRYFKDLGLFAFHAHDARRSEKGYPDWTIAGPGGQLFRELKTQRGKLTREQQAWLDVLAAGGADAGVWRPEHLYSGQIANELVAVAGLRAAAR